MNEAISNILGRNYLLILLLIGLAVVLRRKSRIGNINLKNAWLVFVTITILTTVDILEGVCCYDILLMKYRVLFSVLGYWMRPIVSLSFLSLTVDIFKKKNFVYWIPAIVNILVFSTSFFTKWTFWFDADYEFHRGILGYEVFVVSYFYVICILITTVRTFKSGGRDLGGIMLFGAIGVIGASVLEALGFSSYVLNSSILIAVLLYYLYVFSQVTSRDSGTQLFNRQTFYEDIEIFGKKITSIISIDMNGLKTINDTNGHTAGDEALRALSDVLKSYTGKTTYAYRVGGDEFYVLCLGYDEEKTKALHDDILSSMEKEGVSVSSGYAMITSEGGITKAIDDSDARMYESKAEYYEKTGLDRRRT